MNTSYLPSFIRDLKALKKTPIYATIKQTVFEVIPACSSVDQIPELKKLKGDLSDFFKLRVGDYRVIYDIDTVSQIIIVIRVGHRREIYDL